MKDNIYYSCIRKYYGGNKKIIFIILFALLIRGAFFVIVAPWNQHVLNEKILVLDAGGYQELAIGLLENKSFINFGSFRTPGYPLFLAVIYFVFGIKPWIVLFLQIMANVFSLILVYRLGLLIFNQRIALLAAFLFAIEPHQIIYSLTLLTDTLFVTIFLLSTVYFVSAIKGGKIQSFLLSGFFLGISTLIRPVTVLFPLVIAIVLFLSVNFSVKKKVKFLFVYAFAFMMTLSPWLIRNYVNYGYAQLTSITGTNLLFYNVVAAEAESTGMPMESVRQKYIDMAAEKGAYPENNPFINSQIYSEIALEYMRSNWADYSIRHLKGIVNMFIGLSTQSMTQFLGIKSTQLNINQYSAPSFLNRFKDFFQTKSLEEIGLGLTIAVYLVLCYAFFIAGSVQMIIKKEIFFLIFIALVLGYFSAVTGVVGLSRYKLPIAPFYLLISAKGLFGVLPKIGGLLTNLLKRIVY